MTDYSKHYFCSNCSKSVTKEEAVGAKPKCPKCGRFLRTKPISQRRKFRSAYHDRMEKEEESEVCRRLMNED